MAGPRGTAEEIIGRLASHSHGIVTRAELLVAGVSTAEVEHRLGRGALIPRYRGVYRVGHCAPSLEADCMAAVRACGRHAVLCGRAAAHLYGIVKGPRPLPEVLTTSKRRPPGVRVHRARAIDPREVTTHRGIPITTVPRTLVDMAANLDRDDLARACHEAAVRYGVKPEAVEAVLARRPNAAGAAALRRVLRGEVRVVLSRLERRFLELLAENGLPLPRTNRRAGTHHVDCRWEEPPLTVELDGYRYHGSRHAWERDRRREREARARGDDFRRYTYGDVFEDPAAMLAELRRALRTARRPG